MKKIVSLLLAAFMLVTLLAGCGSTLEEDEKGYTINVYLTSELSDYDPALAYTNDAAVKLLGLVYEGLTRINDKGQVENALLKSYKIIEKPEKNDYRIQLTIRDTKWSDGRVVSADDVVYAWKRILDPEFDCSAAALLFDVKNARDVKQGDNSIDDLGIASIDDTIVEVQFEGPVDYNRFLENLACLALVPLREDVVARYDHFATAVSTMCGNGPFAIKELTLGKSMMLERNVYYYRNTDDEDALDKYVIPYRMMINFADDEEANTAAYEAGQLMYISEIGLSKRASYAAQETTKVTDLLSTHCVQFNTTNKTFKDAAVRKALSQAIDRNAIAQSITFAKPATGLIPDPVYDKAVGDSFRANGGALLSTSADAGAQKGSGSFTLTHRKEAVETKIAEQLKASWEALGYKVTLKALDAADYLEAYTTGKYDAITLDYQCLTTDSFIALAPFAPKFSGMGLDIQNDNYDAVPFVLGYNNDAYNTLIENAYAEPDRAARSAILHDAEKMLLDDMPIIPIVFNQDAYTYNSEALSGLKDSYMGFRIFNRMKLKDWRTYLETAAAAQ